MLKLSNISKSYSDSGNTVDVLLNASAEFKVGSVNALVGASGSGKSTLLNIVGMIDTPDKGDVYYPCGQHLSTILDLTAFRNSHIGFVFQSHNLLPEFTVLENILLPALMNNSDKADYKERAIQLLSTTGILDLKDKFPTQISGGESQRAAVCRSLINRPALILADEPTGSLDKDNSDIIINLLIDLSKRFNTTTLVATHSSDIASRTDFIYKVVDKNILQD